MAAGSPRQSSTTLLSIPPTCCGALPPDPGDPAGKRLSSLDSGHKEVAKKGYVWMDSDKVFAEMCQNCHGQNGIGGEIKEVERVGVHNVAEKLRERRAEPAVEEQGEERISIWSRLPSGGWKYLRWRVRSRLRRPEEVVVLPQLPRGELGGEDCPLLSQRRKPLHLGRLHNLPLVGFQSHGGSGGGGRRRWWYW